MRKAMLVVALFALLPATALAAPNQSARPAAPKSQPAQIASLGGDFPTTLTDEDLVAANADSDTSPLAGHSQAYTPPDRSREQSREPATAEQQPQAGTPANGQPKYVHIYWFIGGH